MENPDSTRLSPISPPSGRSDEEWVDEQLALLCANYANSALSAQDPRTVTLYMEELEELLRRYGRERTAAAIREAMRVSKFLPEISVLWEMVPPAPVRDDTSARMARWKAELEADRQRPEYEQEEKEFREQMRELTNKLFQTTRIA